MPRLLLFAPCQHAIIDRTDATVSLIRIINGMNLEIEDPEEQTGPNVVASFLWAAVAVWERLAEDIGKTFEQRVQIVLPDGQVVGEGSLPFTLSTRTHQNTVSGKEFPVAGPGMYHIRLSLREAGEEHEWHIMAEYPIEVAYPARQ